MSYEGYARQQQEEEEAPIRAAEQAVIDAAMHELWCRRNKLAPKWDVATGMSAALVDALDALQKARGGG